jgi:hypothetical protein
MDPSRCQPKDRSHRARSRSMKAPDTLTPHGRGSVENRPAQGDFALALLTGNHRVARIARMHRAPHSFSRNTAQ